MEINNSVEVPAEYVGSVDRATIAAIVDLWYEIMLDDYRVNRFFYTRPIAEQSAPLKIFLTAALGTDKHSPTELAALLSDYFMTAFARGNAHPSLVTGNDFAFLLDVIGGREIRTVTLLCEAHSHLFKLGPDDENYDVVLEILADTLKKLNLTEPQATKIMAMAEAARDAVLARGSVVLQAA
jgi:truncated hemoglobin YjbI